MIKAPVLGRGFSALLPETKRGPSIQEIPVDGLIASQIQPRKEFVQNALDQLAASIKEKGILQPILARRTAKGLEVVAGERRLRAAKIAGLKTVPVIVSTDLKDGAALELALIENIQREDLNPIEEAEAYERLMDEYGLTHDEIAKRVGKSRSAVTNMLRLLDLPPQVQELLAAGEISAGHARALIGAGAAGELIAIARRIANDKLSVREVEKLVSESGGSSRVRAERDPSANAERGSRPSRPEVRDLVERMQRALGTKVRLVEKNPREGRIEIDYFSPIDFERIVDRISGR
ncbi:MAG: ParB/RepB/Spo0J family partition protein [Deltaproteobacteria bacterium]|nr:ParB/RepB/Spo0J family partition protein [Deltaproteobacteria bacterium]